MVKAGGQDTNMVNATGTYNPHSKAFTAIKSAILYNKYINLERIIFTLRVI